MIAWFVRDIWLKYHSWYFKIHWKFHLNKFEISLVVFIPNITANHSITCTNLQADCLNLVSSVFHLKIGRGTFPAVTVIWASPRFGDPHFQNASDMGFGNGDAQNVGMPAYHCDTAPRAVGCIRCVPTTTFHRVLTLRVLLLLSLILLLFEVTRGIVGINWEVVIAHLKKSLNQWVSRKLKYYIY